MCLELFSDKVEIVPASVAEESGIERESDAGWRCRRFLEIQEHFPSDLNPFRLASCDREEENLILYLFILHQATKTCISWSGAIAEWELGLTARKIRPATTMINRAAIWRVRVRNPSIKTSPKVKTCLIPLSQLPHLELWLPISHSSSSQQSENLMINF